MEALENITYDELEIGDSATYTRTLTEEELILFAAVSGDTSPLNLDTENASKSTFRDRIAHGMWSGSLISAALANVIPGPGTIYLEQSLNFQLPVKLHDTLTVQLTVARKEPANRVVLDCDVRNQEGDVVVSGEAKVIAPSEKITLDRPRLPRITIGKMPDA
ncbi:MaoC/PaaZ C-terminal domain-containing protein [Marinobacteraceae bacterium S3BR75-40.1]